MPNFPTPVNWFRFGNNRILLHSTSDLFTVDRNPEHFPRMNCDCFVYAFSGFGVNVVDPHHFTKVIHGPQF